LEEVAIVRVRPRRDRVPVSQRHGRSRFSFWLWDVGLIELRNVTESIGLTPTNPNRVFKIEAA